MAKRRGRGEGCVSKRKDGRWEGRVDLGWQNAPDGTRKRRYKAVYGLTRRAVQQKLRTYQAMADKGLPLPDERQTVGQFLGAWLALKQGQLRARTFTSYEQVVRAHMRPGLGSLPLAKLTPQQVSAWWTRHQAEDGASTRTIRYARTVLRIALNQALKWELVARNAASLTDAPRHVAREITPLSPEQARTLLDSVKDHRLGALVSVGCALGLRSGELLGLRWLDVDIDAGTLSVAQALERSGGDAERRRALTKQRHGLLVAWRQATKRSTERRALAAQLAELRIRWRDVRTTLNITEPKSKKSKRTIRLPRVVRAALKQHRTHQLEERLACGPYWQDSGLVFTTPIGTPLDPRNVHKVFKGMLTAANLPDVRLHDTRHTAATLLLVQGVAAKVVADTLGHSTVTLTLNTYSHLVPALQQDAADKLDAILSGSGR